MIAGLSPQEFWGGAILLLIGGLVYFAGDAIREALSEDRPWRWGDAPRRPATWARHDVLAWLTFAGVAVVLMMVV